MEDFAKSSKHPNNKQKNRSKKLTKNLNFVKIDYALRKQELEKIEAQRKAVKSLIQKKLKEYFDEYQNKGYSGDELRNKICAKVYEEVNEDFEQCFRADSKATIVHFAKELEMVKNLKFQNPQYTKPKPSKDESDFEDR